MIETKDGIFTGGSQNLGDLPFHLGAIFCFTEGNNFPPENPSFAGAKFSYPFMADLVTAVFCQTRRERARRDACAKCFVGVFSARRFAGKISRSN